VDISSQVSALRDGGRMRSNEAVMARRASALHAANSANSANIRISLPTDSAASYTPGILERSYNRDYKSGRRPGPQDTRHGIFTDLPGALLL
jgi:hypothetical protein